MLPGATLANPDEVAGLDLGRLELTVLQFPKFTDGRAYSQARLLRRAGYEDELRASGAIFRDQLPFLLRCGFDSFESEQPGFGEALANAKTLFSPAYQPAENGASPISDLELQNYYSDFLHGTTLHWPCSFNPLWGVSPMWADGLGCPS